MCNKIAKHEWSGVLFYSVEGSIADFDKVKLKVEDIYPMDKGTQAGTHYELDEKLIDYRMNNPESLKWKVGHIHSHNTMQTYFSGVDMSELNDNSEFHNYYLSLIVNNHMDMKAKVAFRGNSNGFKCKDEQGKDWTLNLTDDRQILFVFNTEIEFETEFYKVEKSFSERVEEIIEEDKKTSLELERRRNLKATTQDWWKTQGHKGNYPSTMHEQKVQREFDFDYGYGNHYPVLPEDDDDTVYSMEDDVDSLDEMYQDFAKHLIRLGDDLGPQDSLDEALEDLRASDIDDSEFAGELLQNYSTLYMNYWVGAYGILEMEEMVDNTKGVIEVLEDYKGVYSVIDKVLRALDAFLLNLKKTQNDEYKR